MTFNSRQRREILDRLHQRSPSWLKRLVLALRFRSATSLFGSPSFRIHLQHEASHATEDHRLHFERTNRDLTLFLDLQRYDQSSHYLALLWKRVPIMIDILSRTNPSVRYGKMNISDGEEAVAGELAFCSADPDSILIPDRFFLTERCYRPFRREAVKRNERWDDRSDLIVWRGGANGPGLIANETMSYRDSTLMQRIRLCLAAAEIPGTDIKLTGIRPEQGSAESRQQVFERGLIGKKLPAEHWFQMKFAFDIDGYTNAWSNLYTRLLMGCCVLKVASPSGYKQWYYDELHPWKHYVPVAADLSDLTERVAWCRENNAAAQDIARAGQLFALQRTRETEILAVTQKINNVLGNHPASFSHQSASKKKAA